MEGAAQEAGGEALAFHYCSPSAFLSILESRKIWATKAAYLEDESDCAWVDRYFREGLAELRVAARKFGRETGDYANLMVDKFVDESRIFRDAGRRHFLTCLSRTSKSLSQWRQYADSGRGFAVGIDLQAMLGAEYKPMGYSPQVEGWKRVEYGRGQVQRMVQHLRGILEYLNESEQELPRREGWYLPTEHIWPDEEVVSKWLTEAFAFIKGEAYEEEQEVRAVFPDSSFFGGTSFKSIRGRIVPAIEVPIESSDGPKGDPILCEVVRGPRCELHEDDLTELLRVLDWSHVKVSKGGVEL